MSWRGPAVRTLVRENPRETSYMRHFGAVPRDGSDCGAPRGGDGPSWTPLAEIAPSLVAALVKSENPRFFEHRGIDWLATRRKAWLALRGRFAGGASTITQQLARNLYLTPTRSLTRKLREMVLAGRIDRAIPKARIVELYLNVVQFGPDVWGCAAASDFYFGKAPRDLDLFESTFLVTLLPAPRAGLSGHHAARCLRGQRLLTCQLFVSGLACADECGSCCDRVTRLHQLLAEGVPWRTALSSTRDGRQSDEQGKSRCEGRGGDRISCHESAALFRDLADVLGIVPIQPADLLTSHCGYAQEGIVASRLYAHAGAETLARVVATGNLEELRVRIPP